jgi:integrase
VARSEGATWSEIDLQAGVWTVPGERMKAGREHRVPLSSQAAKLLQALPRIEGTDYVFPAPRGGQLSDMALTALMRRMKVDAVPHGFRSTFRDWCSERTNYPRDLAEQALAHAIESKVEAAYRRGRCAGKAQRDDAGVGGLLRPDCHRETGKPCAGSCRATRRRDR